MKNGVIVNLGFDDIDSPIGGCTTHFVSRLVISWSKRGWIRFLDYPRLIRLNPAIPWKTRGNGAVALKILVPSEDKAYDLFEEALNNAVDYVKEFRHPESHPAIAMVLGEPDQWIKWLGAKAVRDVVPLGLLDRVLAKTRVPHRHVHIAGRRGAIGAYASIGVTLQETDYTYELIAYRTRENWGRPRLVNSDSVKRMDAVTRGRTFLNYDYDVDKPLITPHGPDPVLVGIRGEEPEHLIEALSMLEILEPLESWVIYRTNQATDMHLSQVSSLDEAYIYTGVRIVVRVASKPRRIHGGHVIVKVTDGKRIMDAAAYEPTASFRDIVGALRPGDLVEVYGIVRPPGGGHGPTINLEKIRIVELAQEVVYEAPRCPRCGSRMKSMGRGKGYKCKKCGYRDPSARKIARIISRSIKPGFYEPPPRCFKHLMKPIERMGREKKQAPQRLIIRWHCP